MPALSVPHVPYNRGKPVDRFRDLGAPVSEYDQLFGKQAPLKTPIDFHPIIVRKEEKLASRPCSQQRVPPKLEGKLYGFRQVLSLMRLELMSRRVI